MLFQEAQETTSAAAVALIAHIVPHIPHDAPEAWQQDVEIVMDWTPRAHIIMVVAAPVYDITLPG